MYPLIKDTFLTLLCQVCNRITLKKITTSSKIINDSIIILMLLDLGNSSLILNLYDLCAHCHTFFCKPLDVHMSVGVGKKIWDVNLSKI